VSFAFETNAIDPKSEKNLHPSCLICKAWYPFFVFLEEKEEKEMGKEH
jgi:hypothetical protein